MNQAIKIKPISPSTIDPDIQKIIGYLGLSEKSISLIQFTDPVDFIPEINQCHLNVWIHSNNHGGTVQFGWVIFQDKAYNFSEAMFHAVWKTPEGTLVDVTPRSDKQELLMFIPDHERKITLFEHEGLPALFIYDNVRLRDSNFMSKLRRFGVIIESDLLRKHGLWIKE